MAATTSPVKATYELPVSTRVSAHASAKARHHPGSLPAALLVQNVRWFCLLRWFVIGILASFWLLSFFPQFTRTFGLRPGPYGWALVTALVLAVANAGLALHAAVLSRQDAAKGARASLWLQIGMDLTVLTAVVHFAGSLETFIPFTYLFHIVLACIFFSRAQSLGVTVLASVLYSSCVTLERAGLLSAGGMYDTTTLSGQVENMPGSVPLNVLGTVLTWVVVWYLASHLSAMVRQRDAELAEANTRLREVHARKARDMLRMTHELKAPFAAVDANAQALLKGYCGPISDKVTDIVVRISERCRRLANEIQEMLQLANLEPSEERVMEWSEVQVADVLEECVTRVSPLAQEHGITLEKRLNPGRIVAVAEHLMILFMNLLANAVRYSHQGGHVSVACRVTDGEEATVDIEDQGIGIPDTKMPHIFDDYYRTTEAIKHNKQSTGLGLAIVQRIAEMYGYGIRVESTVGVGTRLTVRLPSTVAQPPGAA